MRNGLNEPMLDAWSYMLPCRLCTNYKDRLSVRNVFQIDFKLLEILGLGFIKHYTLYSTIVKIQKSSNYH